uniref:Uncharacterized protein n=1 Tax=Tanacetum cinerariifolium TaxID=118510 RepID=A0A6L2P9G1_TANCI|nr:hypothetical protein [Tanacetum cinerariifolium]
MAMSLIHQWHDTISGGVIGPRRSVRMHPSDLVDTPMVEKSKLDEDPQGKAIDHPHYRGMVGTLCISQPVDQTLHLLYACVPDIKQSLPKSTYMV